MDLNANLTKNLACLIKHLRAHVKGVVQIAVLFDGSDDGFFPLAEYDVMVAESKTGHAGSGQTADVL
jgi:hypothetical protein